MTFLNFDCVCVDSTRDQKHRDRDSRESGDELDDDECGD
jgi:hypothetical protein